jgi:hypothetical protein
MMAGRRKVLMVDEEGCVDDGDEGKGVVEDTRRNASPNPLVVDEEPSNSVPAEEQDDDNDNDQNRPLPYCNTPKTEGRSCHHSHLFYFSCFQNSLGLRKS